MEFLGWRARSFNILINKPKCPLGKFYILFHIFTKMQRIYCLGIFFFFISLVSNKYTFLIDFISISVITNKVKHILICRDHSVFLTLISIEMICFILLTCKSFFYIGEISYLSYELQMFFQFVICLSNLFNFCHIEHTEIAFISMFFFCVWSNWSIVFCCCCSRVSCRAYKKRPLTPGLYKVLPYFPSRTLTLPFFCIYSFNPSGIHFAINCEVWV